MSSSQDHSLGSLLADNPLASDSPQAWDQVLEAVGPASLLVVIESRMSATLKHRMAAEDIWQEVLLHAWRDRAQFEWRGVKSFRSWLLTLIDHRIHEAVVREGAQKRGGGAAAVSLSGLAPGRDSSSQDSQLPVPFSSTTPSRIAILCEQAEAMRTALESLPEDLRDVVRLRLFEQLTLEEVANELGVTVAAVRYRFARGVEVYRERLRAYLTSRSQAASAESAANRPAESATNPPADL